MELGMDRSIRHWWVFLLRGILFVLVGIYMIAAPGSSYAALGFLFGLVIFIAGVVELLHAYRDNSRTNRGWHLVLGIIDIILGLVLMGHIAASAAILRIVVGLWFLFCGISIFSFSGLIRRSWMITFAGIITIVFGVLILFNPVFGAMTIVLWTAIAFIVTGLFNVWLGYRLKAVLP